jgi:NAD(P)-dependent dehydrogenase (short-subunit alcohol dehydrogenase family)
MAGVLEGKVAVVTGAGSGIGQGAAEMLAGEGARVLCVDLNETAAAKAASECGGKCFATNLADEDAGDAIIAAARDAFGPLDIIVQSAGVAAQKSFLDTTAAHYDFCYSVNQRGLALAARAAAADMIASDAAKRGGGRIINIASVSGRRGSVGRAAYGATKAAVINLTQVMATELGPLGLTANCVAPGPVNTAMVAAAHTEASRAAWNAAVPMGRYGAVDEIAAAILFLASPASSYVNGLCLDVDGGYAGAGLQYAGE